MRQSELCTFTQCSIKVLNLMHEVHSCQNVLSESNQASRLNFPVFTENRKLVKNTTEGEKQNQNI